MATTPDPDERVTAPVDEASVAVDAASVAVDAASEPTATHDATEASEAPVIEEPTSPLLKVWAVLKDFVSPRNVGILAGLLVLLTVGAFGGWDRVAEEKADDVPRIEAGKVIAADPFTITIRKAAWASEINVLRPAENTRYLLVSADITATGDTFVAWPLLYSSIDIEAEGLTSFGKPAPRHAIHPQIRRINDGLMSGALQPGLTQPTLLAWEQSTTTPLPTELTITVRSHTLRASSLTGAEEYLDATEVAHVTVPVKELGAR